MAQTINISLPESVANTRKVFPQLGKINVALKRRPNGSNTCSFRTWGSDHQNNPITIVGGTFVSWAVFGDLDREPTSVNEVNDTSLTLVNYSMCFFTVKLDDDVDVAYLQFPPYLGDTSLIGGNNQKELRVDYSKKPYIVTSLAWMFYNHNIPDDITDWDVSSILVFGSAFRGSIAFNQNISRWNLQNAKNISAMFAGASSFNQPIGSWNVSSVTDIDSLFFGATKFNQDLSTWNTSSIATMARVFTNCVAYNKPLNTWNVSNSWDFTATFQGCVAFNQPLNNWNTSNGTAFISTFWGATSFNQPIGNWVTSRSSTFRGMFYGASAFNQDISSWDSSAVTDMAQMFEKATAFNQNIIGWKIEGVQDMWRMFAGATAFNYDLSPWCARFHIEVSLHEFMVDKRYSTNFYDNFLNALWKDIGSTRKSLWASRVKDKLLGMGLSKYSSASADARQSLINAGWTISDGGLS